MPEQETSYKDEWERQFGVKLSKPEEEQDPEPENTPEQEEIEEQDAPEPEQEVEEGQEAADPPEKPEKQEEPPKPKSKDDEYREFIESQPNEELKDRARKLIQGLKSADGRTSALHRTLNAREQLIKQLYAQSGTRADQKQGSPTSPPPDKKEQEPSRQLPPKFEALKKKNPQAAEIIEEVAKYHSDLSVKQVQDLIDSRLGKIEEQEQSKAKEQEWNRLEQKAAALFSEDGLTAADVVRSEDFRAWLELKRMEEPGVYKLYQSASDVDTAYMILEKYHREYEAAIREAGQEQDLESRTPASKGDELRRKRDKVRKQSKTPQSRRAGTPTSDNSDLDYKQEWELVWGKNGTQNKT